MSGTEHLDFAYNSEDDSTAANTPSNYNWQSSRRQSNEYSHQSPQGARRSSADLIREEPASFALNARPDRPQGGSTPAEQTGDILQRPRPALRAADSHDGHHAPERAERNKGVRFGSNEKGDGRRSTIYDGYTGPLQFHDLAAVNEKLSHDTDSVHDGIVDQTQSDVEAHRLVRHFTNQHHAAAVDDADLESGLSTPRRSPREGLLSMLLRLNHRPGSVSGTSTPLTPGGSPPPSGTPSGTSTPRLFAPYSTSHSTSSLSALLSSSSKVAIPTATQASSVSDFNRQVNEKLAALEREQKRQRKKENRNSSTLNTFKRFTKKKDKHEKVRTLIADTIDKQHYIVKLCRALIRYGAPSHRLEAYMRTSADSLGIGGQFLYIPGCMIISFDDENTHTAEVKLVRENQGVDLGRMDSCHNIYKQVANGTLLVREGHELLTDLMKRDPKFSRPTLVLMYGIAAAAVGPFAFQARGYDIPMAFVLGCIVGFLQYYVNAQSELWASCFTVLAPLLTSALARVFGSIAGGKIFCFSALAQSSIALILPGYTVLCSALELQSGSMVAGSIRLVYAIIYSLFLGFGITIGTAIIGAIWTDATSATTCPHPIGGHWFFFAVPVFTLCLTIINQAKWKQAPVQMFISLAGYQVNYWVSQYVNTPSVSNAAGACAIGLLANMYARFGYHHEQKLFDWCRRNVKPHVKKWTPRWIVRCKPGSSREQQIMHQHGIDTPTEGTEGTIPYKSTRNRVTYGLAAAAMLPAIWVQVPSGLSVGGSLISGIASADQITSNTTSTASSDSSGVTSEQNMAVLMVAFSVVQIAIGITVGLFISTVIVYPRGKKGGGVFTM